MAESLLSIFLKFHSVSKEGEVFLTQLEGTCAQDLWLSAGGHWSSESIQTFRRIAMEKLAEALKGDGAEDYQSAWIEVVRSFHASFWGQQRLPKKEKAPISEEKKIFWELFSYIWIMLQATLITKTAVFYFGIKSAQEDTSEGKIYVGLAILFSFISLIWFAIRKSKKTKQN